MKCPSFRRTLQLYRGTIVFLELVNCLNKSSDKLEKKFIANKKETMTRGRIDYESANIYTWRKPSFLVEFGNHSPTSVSASLTPRMSQSMILWLSHFLIHLQNLWIHRSAVIVQCMARMGIPTETLTSPAKRKRNKTGKQGEEDRNTSGVKNPRYLLRGHVQH